MMETTAATVPTYLAIGALLTGIDILADKVLKPFPVKTNNALAHFTVAGEREQCVPGRTDTIATRDVSVCRETKLAGTGSFQREYATQIGERDQFYAPRGSQYQTIVEPLYVGIIERTEICRSWEQRLPRDRFKHQTMYLWEMTKGDV